MKSKTFIMMFLAIGCGLVAAYLTARISAKQATPDTQPVLVANGDNDRMVPTRNSDLLAAHLPDARLRIYPDAGHGFLFQYPVEFAADVQRFLA